ncbi:PREDICTED: olfactory receptor 7D4-like [Condylura cristata]|uniref:olfactory receptor 7D4-like n=1 Tax=Condylura cristata TaxID=143302 RepID=UPI0006428DE8|nr:PREDICTED: olfactory receptor 7D4-like [Condylura cristata]
MTIESLDSRSVDTFKENISVLGCLAQVYFFMIFVGMDNLLLTVMAYDRFVAICHPLHYMVIMSPWLCGLLVLMCWLINFWVSLLLILLIAQLTFCTDTEIPHFFCELAQTVKVACSDTLIVNICLYVSTAILGVFPAAGILCSYSQIAASLVKMSSSTSKHRAFSTCGSHLCVVSLFYGTGLGVYLSSAATQSSEESSVASVMYTVVTPMLNPFIYSLRNKDVKGALGKLFRTVASCPLPERLKSIIIIIIIILVMVIVIVVVVIVIIIIISLFLCLLYFELAEAMSLQ